MAFKKQALETLSYSSGSIVDDDAEVLVNTVNCRLSPSGRGVMGKGVAEAFKNRFPSIMGDYEDAIRSGELRPGRALFFDLPDGRKWVALGTKDEWRDNSQMEWVEKGLTELGEKLRSGGFKSVAIPPPGCGNGGLDWKKVEPLLHEALKGVEVSLYGRPSGAMVPRRENRTVGDEIRDNTSDMAKRRDQDVVKALYGKIVDVPDMSFEHSTAGDMRAFRASFSVREHEGGRVIPVSFTSDLMSSKSVMGAMSEMERELTKGAEVSLGGKWHKPQSSGAWAFSAARVAAGMVPLQELRSDNPSRMVIADPAMARLASFDRPEVPDRSQPAKGRYPFDENTQVAMPATMYFKYGAHARPGIKSASTFDAILDGERTSTTRYDEWPQSARWGKLEKGDLVRFFEDKHMKGRSVIVRVDSVERIDMRTMSEAQREEWSKAEGWSVEHCRDSARSHSGGYQVRYTPVPGQAILEGRGASHLASLMEGMARSHSSGGIADASRMERAVASANAENILKGAEEQQNPPRRMSGGMAAALSGGLSRGC